MSARFFGRRRFLRGLGGVTLGLPFLPSLLPRAQAQATSDRSYGIFLRGGNGVAQAYGEGEGEAYFPASFGALSSQDFGDRALGELSSYASSLSVLQGLRFAFPGNGCGHSGGGNQVLTAARVSEDPSGSRSLAEGESVDNRIARTLNPLEGGVRREPLTLFVGRKGTYLGEVLSYRGAQQLRSAENNPALAYQSMVGLRDLDAEARLALIQQRNSINDLVRDELSELRGSASLSRTDRIRLDTHLEAVRNFEDQVDLSCGLPDEDVLLGLDANSDADFQRLANLQMELAALSVACGYSRAVTIQLGSGNDHTRYTIPGYRDGVELPSFHQISHRIYSDGSEGDPIEGAAEMHHEVDKLHLRVFRHLLDQLEAHGVLDDGVSLLTNDLAHGVSHSYRNIPFVLAGSAGGNLVTDQHLDVRGGGDWVTHNKLFNTLLTAVGVTKDDGSAVDDFGDESLEGGFIDALIASGAANFA